VSAISARRWPLALALTAAGLLLAGVVALDLRSSPPAPSTTVPADQRGFPALTWAPPAAWQQYAAATVPTQGGTITLRSDTDYRLSASGTITRPVVIRGGRDVVWIGGHIRIDEQASAAPGTARRGLVIADAPDGSSVDGRVVHLEGLLIDGDDLSEGIDPACPSAIVQLANVHVGLVHIRGIDDRDGTGSYQHENHADVLQPFGGFRELRVDGLTGSSNYQGIYHSVDLGTAYGRSWFRRVDLTAREVPGEEVIEGRVIGHAGHRMYRANVDRLGQQRIDTGTFWVQHHPNSGWAGGRFHRVAYRDADGVLREDPVAGTATFTDAVWAGTRTAGQVPHTLATDALGTYAAWPATLTDVNGDVAIRNWDDTAAGRIYSGAPPEGDYVPATAVGEHYVSPGYAAASPVGSGGTG
jgi:hypothetical protein